MTALRVLNFASGANTMVVDSVNMTSFLSGVLMIGYLTTHRLGWAVLWVGSLP